MSFRDRVNACVGLAASFVLAGSAVAQTQPGAQPAPADERRIVVTGQAEPPSEAEIVDQARNISIIGDPLHNPLPRFEDHLCPGVLGLREEAAALVIERIRFNAGQIGVRMAVDDGTCKPNLILAFLNGAHEQLTALAKDQGYMFAGLSVSARGELLDASGAAHVWANTLTRTRDGMPVPSQRDGAGAPERMGQTSMGTNSRGETVMGQTGAKMPPVAAMQSAHSRIFFPTREDIVSVMVLFDQDAVRGKTLIQLADYATMRGLASTRETKGETAAATILSLFDGEGPKPERLTQFDEAYLAALYAGMANLPATAKLADVSQEMEKAAGESRE